MEQSTAQRRLVTSPPGLWSELSSEPSLARHLAHCGEIRITPVEPDTTVAWEGERASGTVELAPNGWGTTVILATTPTRSRSTRAGSGATAPGSGPGADTRAPALGAPRREAILAAVLGDLGAAHHRDFPRD